LHGQNDQADHFMHMAREIQSLSIQLADDQAKLQEKDDLNCFKDRFQQLKIF
jgi:hypothetical protein